MLRVAGLTLDASAPRRTGLAPIVALARWAGAAWFVAATSHGAALMLVPALLPLCTGARSVHGDASGAWLAATTAVALHVLVMVVVAAVVTARTDRVSRRSQDRMRTSG